MMDVWEPGKYRITVGSGGDEPNKVDVDVDTFRYGGRDGNELQAVKDNKVVASWRWWDSIELIKSAKNDD
jgi:hypothetical protein